MGEKPMMPMESSDWEMKLPHWMPMWPKKGMHPMMPFYDHKRHHVKEPYLLEHLYKLLGVHVEVATTCKTVRGTLKEVCPDHIIVKHDGREYHIRLKTICFVSPIKDP